MKLSFKKISTSSAKRKFFYFWIRHYKALFTLLFLVVTGIGGFQWYRDLYRYSWNDEERKTYLDSAAKETSFQEARFREAIKKIESEAETHIQTIDPGRDLFAGARKKER